jgi:hypothetical protein
MEGYGGPAQPSPTIGQCIHGGLGWLEVECNRCKTRASLPLDAIRRPRDTPLWKLEASLKCRSCRKGRSAPPVHMSKLTATQEITPLPLGASGRGALLPLFEPMTDGISLADDTDHRDRLGDGRGRAVGSEAAITEIVMASRRSARAADRIAGKPWFKHGAAVYLALSYRLLVGAFAGLTGRHLLNGLSKNSELGLGLGARSIAGFAGILRGSGHTGSPRVRIGPSLRRKQTASTSNAPVRVTPAVVGVGSMMWLFWHRRLVVIPQQPPSVSVTISMTPMLAETDSAVHRLAERVPERGTDC